MYKIVDKENHDIWLGNKEAVIFFANDLLKNREDWIQEYHKYLTDIGCVVKFSNFWYVEDIQNIELAIKYLQKLECYEVVDLGNILDDLKNGNLILLSQEE